MSGGEFHAQDVSNFRGGSDLFKNETGATVRTADRYNANEVTRFIGLERFENRGLITMVDGQIGDQFRISNTPGGTDTVFTGSSGSTLGVDTFLGGPGSKSDTLVIEGSAKGRTRLAVNNVNPGPGRLNREGIPVVFVDGNVNASNFYLDKPIDTGFFEYDLFFVPTGSGFFELRSHAGGGAHVLPQIVTTIHETIPQLDGNLVRPVHGLARAAGARLGLRRHRKAGGARQVSRPLRCTTRGLGTRRRILVQLRRQRDDEGER